MSQLELFLLVVARRGLACVLSMFIRGETDAVYCGTASVSESSVEMHFIERPDIRPTTKFDISGRFAPRRGIFFLLGMAFLGTVQAFLPVFHNAPQSEARATESKIQRSDLGMALPGLPKPWGDFEYTKLPLEEPHKRLPDTAQPLEAPRWFFQTDSRQQLVNLFNTSALTEDQKQGLIDERRWQRLSNGFYVFPPPQVVLEMSRAARERIYSILANEPANSAQCHPFRFRPESFEEWFAGTGLGFEQLELLRKLIYSQGGSLCFCDGAIAQGLFSTNDFKRLVKSLYGERTFLMKLRVTPRTDIDSLVQYWDHGGRAEALRPFLESLAQLPGGGSINISLLLPPFARARLYTYAEAPSGDAPAPENCFWTAMNFFKEKPDNRFLNPEYVQLVLASDYEQISAPPGFGDIISLQGDDGTPIHMCAYLADEVVFTKNGRDYIEPWVLMKLPDVIAGYKAKAPIHVAIYRARKV